MSEAADEATPKPAELHCDRRAFAFSPAACGFARSDEDAAPLATAINGPHPSGATMRLPCTDDELCWLLAALVLLGSGLSLLVTLLRGEG